MKLLISILLILICSCSNDADNNSPGDVADMDSVMVSTITLNQSVKFDGLLYHSDGYIYAGEGWDGLQIFRVTLSGNISVFASAMKGPIDMVEGDDGSIFVTEWRSGNVMKITTNGVKSIFLSDPDGQPTAIARDSAGYFYVNWVNKMDASAALKKFDTNGNLLKTYTVNISNPSGIVFDSQGNLYMSELYTNQLKKIAVGSDIAVTIGNAHPFHGTQGLGKLLIKNDLMYAPDLGNHVIYQITLDGLFSVLAGKLETKGTTNGNSSQARFTNPNGMTILPGADIIYVKSAYTPSNRFRKIIF